MEQQSEEAGLQQRSKGAGLRQKGEGGQGVQSNKVREGCYSNKVREGGIGRIVGSERECKRISARERKPTKQIGAYLMTQTAQRREMVTLRFTGLVTVIGKYQITGNIKVA